MAEPAAGNLPIKMLHDRVLVSADGDGGERKSGGGIVIPATASVGKRLAWAEVVAVGQHVRQVKIGDRVLFDPEDRAEVGRPIGAARQVVGNEPGSLAT